MLTPKRAIFSNIEMGGGVGVGRDLMLKIVVQSVLTSVFSGLFIWIKVLPSPEDYGGKNKDKPLIHHADVERVRRYVRIKSEDQTRTQISCAEGRKA